MSPNKLLAEIEGKPLVRIVTEQALSSNATHTIVVTGHQADQVENALHGLNVTFVRNPNFCRWACHFGQGRDLGRFQRKPMAQ